MSSISPTSRPGYVYDSATDTWIPIGIGPHTHAATDISGVVDDSLIDARGDLIVGTAADTPGRLAVGANGTVLTANSATATGLEWGTLSVSDNFSVVANTTFSSASSINFTSLSATNSYLLFIRFTDGSGTSPTLRINSDSGSNYRGWMAGWQSGGSTDNGAGYTTNDTSAVIARKWTTGGIMTIRIDGVGSAGRKAIQSWYNSGSGSAQGAASYNSSSTVTSFQLTFGTATTGDYILLGA